MANPVNEQMDHSDTANGSATQAPERTDIPPVIREIRDPENLISGRSILVFKRLLDYAYAEVLTIKLRGRKSLPPARFFREHAVIAIDVPADYDPPLKGGWFLRHVFIEPETACNLIERATSIEPTKKLRFILPNLVNQKVTPVGGK